jgi:hypothetical protein
MSGPTYKHTFSEVQSTFCVCDCEELTSNPSLITLTADSLLPGSTLGQETALSRLADLRSKWRGWQEQKAPATLGFSLRSPASLSKGAAALVPVPQAPFLAPARPAWLPRNSLLGERAGHRGPPTPELAGPNPAMEAREIFDSEILKMDAEEGVPREDSGHVAEDPPPKRMLSQVRRAKKRSKGGRRFTEGF